MAGNIRGRMTRLERARPGSLPLRVRAWLGQTLTAAEEAELAALPPEKPFDHNEPVDLSGWSPEDRRWWLEGAPPLPHEAEPRQAGA